MEYLSEGILTTIIGMGVVFTVLIALSFCIQALNYIVDKATSSPMPIQVVTDLKTNKHLDIALPEIVAIVTASICALSGKSDKDFRIKEMRIIGKQRGPF